MTITELVTTGSNLSPVEGTDEATEYPARYLETRIGVQGQPRLSAGEA